MKNLKFHEIVKNNKELNTLFDENQKKINISILSNISIHQLKPIIEYNFRSNNLNVDVTVKEFGGLDIMICGAGISGFVHRGTNSTEPLIIENVRVEDWDLTFAVNMKGVFLCNQAAAPIFRKQNAGKIVNISSVGGRRPNENLIAYAASKAAVINFTQSMAVHMAPHHVNVNCVCPGIIYTPMWKGGVELFSNLNPDSLPEGTDPKVILDSIVDSEIPFKKYQTPEDIGKAVLFLSSEEAEEITGQSLNVCGGMAFN